MKSNQTHCQMPWSLLTALAAV